MEITGVKQFGRDELLGKLKQTRLRGHGQAEIYRDATLELVPQVQTDLLTPAQRYLLRGNVRTILELRQALLAWREPVDLFRLDGGLWVQTKETGDAWIPVIPPIVEESVERGGRAVLLINDGMHRVFAARSLGLPISIVVARGVPAEYPYYAYALDGGWRDVELIDELTDDYKKKTYRDPQNYKALFRDFNAVFEGVQAERKQTHPKDKVA